jgi:hypothetical protein
VFKKEVMLQIQLGWSFSLLTPWAFSTMASGFFFMEPQRHNILKLQVIKYKMLQQWNHKPIISTGKEMLLVDEFHAIYASSVATVD